MNVMSKYCYFTKRSKMGIGEFILRSDFYLGYLNLKHNPYKYNRVTLMGRIIMPV